MSTLTETRSFPVVDPATLEQIDDVQDFTMEEVDASIARAHEALPVWRRVPSSERAAILQNAGSLILERVDELARILTSENGKPLEASRGEVANAVRFLRWDAEEGRRLYGRTIPSPRPNTRYFTIQQPVGVVAAITPWNFPALVVMRKIGPALAAGCPVLLRPSPATPLTAMALRSIFVEAGLPEDVLQVVTTLDGPPIGDRLSLDPRVAMITFTGSTAVGIAIAQQAARKLKRTAMELGGCAPLIAFPDADVDLVVDGVMGSRFRNGGQSCIATNRLFAHRDIAPALLDAVAERTAALKLGSGLDPDTEMGPLINEAAAERLMTLQQDAVERGSRIVHGGERVHPDGLPGFFHEPTIVTDIPEGASLLSEEAFGPLLSVQTFDSEEDVLARANSTRYGLSAYVYTSDLGIANRMSEELEFGVVEVNGFAPVDPALPFGGVKESGIGKECGVEGVLEYVETKTISMSFGAAAR